MNINLKSINVSKYLLIWFRLKTTSSVVRRKSIFSHCAFQSQIFFVFFIKRKAETARTVINQFTHCYGEYGKWILWIINYIPRLLLFKKMVLCINTWRTWRIKHKRSYGKHEECSCLTSLYGSSKSFRAGRRQISSFATCHKNFPFKTPFSHKSWAVL